MESDSKTAMDFGSNKRTKEWIDNTVSTTFDELFMEITSKPQLHPSEQHNRDSSLLEHSLSKIYDLINSYHAFCKLCEQHFYSRSLRDDINSFFQKHINTSYHKQMRIFGLPPNDVPMFTWEEKFLSGRCNVCDMSGLNSYVLDTKLNPLKLMQLHFCIWDQENRKTNDKVLKKLNFLKKFCGLTIFRKMYLKTINEREVCLLCGLNLPWSAEKASCHLFSDLHYQKFCALLKKYFDFAPKDALNGFNLEMITRRLISCDPPIVKEFVECDERRKCFKDSNSEEILYVDDKYNYSYSPKSVEKLLKTQEAEFVHKKECLLCNVPFLPGHMSSEQHQTEVINLEEECFYTSEKSLHIIENYRSLKFGLDEASEPLPSKKKIKLAKQTTSSEVNFFQNLFMTKLKWVSVKCVAANEGEIICQVCDQHLLKKEEIMHFNSLHHKSQEMKWEMLKELFANEKFMDPFRRIKKVLVCLLCGAVFNTNSFFSHLKGDMHMRKFMWYCNLNSDIPISSALVIRADLSCYCAVCNIVLSQAVSFSSLKTALKNIRLHWPCPKIEEKKAKSTNEEEVINERKKELVEKNENAVQDMYVTCLACGKMFQKSEMKTHNTSCSENTVDFKKVEKTVESIMNTFEKKIINNTFYKSAYLISGLDNSKLTATKDKIKKSLEMEGQPTAYASCECGQSLKCLCLEQRSSKDERKEEVDEKCEKIVKNEFRILKTESSIKKQKEGVVINEKEKEFMSEEEKKEESTSEKEKKEESTLEKKKKRESVLKKTKKKRDSILKKKLKRESILKKENDKESTPMKEKKEEFKKEKDKEPTPMKEKKEEFKKENDKESTPMKEKKEEFKKENDKESTPMKEKKEEFKKEKDKERTPMKEKGESTTKEEEERNGETHEILIIEGLPKGKRKAKSIYSKFSAFGKIRYLYCETKAVVLAFVEPGIAETVAKGPEIFINDHRLSFKVSTRKNTTKAEEKLFSMNQDLIHLLQDPQKLMDFVLSLTVQAEAASNSPVERTREELVCSSIISSTFEQFPQGRCYPFGSRLSGLMLNNSDLDVFLDCGGMYEGFKKTASSSQKTLVNQVAKLLRKNPEITKIVVVDRARVPIVSFLHAPTLLRCDLSFKNGLSIQNTLLIKFMLSLDWRVRPIILFLKYWTKVNKLHGPPYFSSYAIAMLVIYYLEQLECPVLPTIEYLQNSYVGRRTTIGGWDCSININTPSLPKSDNKDPIPLLLSGLFEFYADFDYNKNIISPLTGKPLPRKAFSSSGFSKLPMSYKRHILNIPTPIENLVNNNILICIMDPFDLSHILTKSFTFQGLQMFISFCQTSTQHLKKGLPSKTKTHVI